VRENDAANLSTIVLSRTRSVGTHDVDEDMFVDQRVSQVSRRDRPEHGIDLVTRISRRAAVPDGPECHGGNFEQIAALHDRDYLLYKVTPAATRTVA
jgi:hypothetical protein